MLDHELEARQRLQEGNRLLVQQIRTWKKSPETNQEDEKEREGMERKEENASSRQEGENERKKRKQGEETTKDESKKIKGNRGKRQGNELVLPSLLK